MNYETRVQMWKSIDGGVTEKAAELANTYDMPLSISDKNKNSKSTNPATLRKVASVDDLLKEAFAVVDQQPETRAVAEAMSPVVDVSGQDAVRPIEKRASAHYALPYLQRYPLDSYSDVKLAASYFNDWESRMDAGTKREYCTNLVKRASDLGIEVSESAQRYAAHEYGSADFMKVALDARRAHVEDDVQLEVLSKLAEVRDHVEADVFAEVVAGFDRSNQLEGLYHLFPDPYVTTFMKMAEDETENDALIVGNEYLPKRKLVTFARMGREAVTDRFGEEIAKEFASDPLTVFNSLPRDQKLVMMRMASSVDAQFQSATKS